MTKQISFEIEENIYNCFKSQLAQDGTKIKDWMREAIIDYAGYYNNVNVDDIRNILTESGLQYLKAKPYTNLEMKKDGDDAVMYVANKEQIVFLYNNEVVSFKDIDILHKISGMLYKQLKEDGYSPDSMGYIDTPSFLSSLAIYQLTSDETDAEIRNQLEKSLVNWNEYPSLFCINVLSYLNVPSVTKHGDFDKKWFKKYTKLDIL